MCLIHQRGLASPMTQKLADACADLGGGGGGGGHRILKIKMMLPDWCHSLPATSEYYVPDCTDYDASRYEYRGSISAISSQLPRLPCSLSRSTAVSVSCEQSFRFKRKLCSQHTLTWPHCRMTGGACISSPVSLAKTASRMCCCCCCCCCCLCTSSNQTQHSYF